MAHSSEIEKLERRWMDNPTGLTFAPLAEAYRRAGDHPRALEVLELGLVQHPAYVPALIVQARCHLDARLSGEAEASFHAVLTSDPHNLIALKGLADICEMTERLPSAQGFLDRLLEAEPTHEEASLQRERIANLLGRRDAMMIPPAGTADPVTTMAQADPSGILEVELDPAPAAELESVAESPIERSGEFSLTAMESPSAESVEAAVDVSSDAEITIERMGNPLEGFDASTWDLPFAEVEVPTQPFDENLVLAPMPEPVAEYQGQDGDAIPEIIEVVVAASLVAKPETMAEHNAAEQSVGASEADGEMTVSSIDVPQADPEAPVEWAPVAGATAAEAEPDVEPVVPPEEFGALAQLAADATDSDRPGEASLASEPAPAEVEASIAVVTEVAPAIDLRLGGEEFVEVEAGWMSSTDWSDHQPAPDLEPVDEAPVSSPTFEVAPPAPVEAPVAQGETVAAGEPSEVVAEAAEHAAGSGPGAEESMTAVAVADEPELVEAIEAPEAETEDAVTVVEGAFEESPAEASEPAPEVEPELLITETMAAVFLRQGHRPLALAVYAQLLEREPGNQRLLDAVARLRGELLDQLNPDVPSQSAARGEPEEPIGSFLARVLGPEARDDEVPPAPTPEPEPPFAGPLGGRPTRPAEDPSFSLSTVFGDDPRRQPATRSGVAAGLDDAEPSFDEFFGETAVPAGVGGDEAELEQFNAWLRSLQR